MRLGVRTHTEPVRRRHDRQRIDVGVERLRVEQQCRRLYSGTPARDADQWRIEGRDSVLHSAAFLIAPERNARVAASLMVNVVGSTTTP